MVALKALLYAVAVFAALGAISLMVAAIMKLMDSILKHENKSGPENKPETGAASR
jgi:hypothetical protein